MGILVDLSYRFTPMPHPHNFHAANYYTPVSSRLAGRLEMDFIRVAPAQGRDYKSKEKALADWRGNKDFEIVWGKHSGRVVNKDEADILGLAVQIRYWRRTRLTEWMAPATRLT